MANDEMENFTYDISSAGHHVKGHMLNVLEEDEPNETDEVAIEHLLSLY